MFKTLTPSLTTTNDLRNAGIARHKQTLVWLKAINLSFSRYIMASNIQPDPLYPTLDIGELSPPKITRPDSKPKRPPNPTKKVSNDTQPEDIITPTAPIDDTQPEVVNIHTPVETIIEIEQVRWFYREPDKYWQAFCGSDSIRLEQSYRVYGLAKCIRIPVLGDMYEVDLLERILVPIYWELCGKRTVVTRAWWFEVISDNWYPFDEKHLPLLDEIHGNVLAAEKTGTIVIKDSKSANLKVQIGDSEITWQSSTDIRRSKLDLTSRLLGFKGNPVKRGYKTAADLSDVLPPIGHIVFVLHGVGQAMESASIIKCTDSVREIAKTMSEKYFPYKSKSSRVEFFPVNWRTQLILDKGFVSKITLTDAKGFRNMLNLSVGDVMYYSSARFGPEILDSLLLKLNTLYMKFTNNNPEFASKGKVSILAHSLGSVVMFDALYSCKSREQVSKPLDEAERMQIKEELNNLQLRAKVLQDKLSNSVPTNHLYNIYHTPTCSSRKLSFQVEHFFAIGSPLAIFISLRNLDEYIDTRYKSCLSLFPYEICKRFYNIFHPADPVTYRMEPLISQIYSQIKPLSIENASSKPSEDAVTLAMGPYLPKIPENTTSSSFSRFFSRSSTIKKQYSIDTIDTNVCLENDSSLILDEKLIERFDFALKEGMLESSHLNFLTAHTGYWESKETILFILLQIFNFVPKPSVT
ncbi:Phospholipase DDHD1-like [Oopsacas minuta]|uniref:Phospholipase DDHD1-like n=1 Tax=Oopsacas minuta TaxID=111878 RepID=A0AAV7KAL7_9METZ|nr:Phospholipase DDHD1-like [Oopsacas minuta]